MAAEALWKSLGVFGASPSSCLLTKPQLLRLCELLGDTTASSGEFPVSARTCFLISSND